MKQVLELLHKFSHTGRSVDLVWIPSHVGVSGNEVVDQAAKAALSKSQFDRHIEPETAEVTNFVNNFLIIKWQKQWDESQTGIIYRHLEPEVSNTSVKFWTQSRRKETCITRLRFGKCKLLHYLHAIKCHPDGLCRACRNTPETIYHYIFECKSQVALQQRLQDKCTRTNNEFSFKTVLSLPGCIDILYDYLKEKKIQM